MKLDTFLPVAPESHFSIYNLPYGVFTPLAGGPTRVGVAIGNLVLDLALLQKTGFFAGTVLAETAVFSQPNLNAFIALGAAAWNRARTIIQTLLLRENPTLRDNISLRQRAFWPLSAVRLHMPVQISEYTDFYASKEHASNVGAIFGRETPLLENWLHLPIAYHGRASSIVMDGTPIRRPRGQRFDPDRGAPIFAPTAELDFELEIGFFVGPGNSLGQPIPIERAEEQIFGLVLLNDWSARDIQRWEYRPLGPFLGKNFATSISPWVVPLAALQPFRVPAPVQEPPPLPYLQSASRWTYDIHLEARLQTTQMTTAVPISRTNFRYLYWSMAQQIAHHTSNGCNLRAGDLLATGTISGPTPDSAGCLLELSWGGARPIALPGGETRAYLQNGDRLTLTGWCQGEGYRVGFGSLTGLIIA